MSLNNIRGEIGEYFESHIKSGESDFLCLYGSSVYTKERRHSDLDLFVVTDTQIAMGALIAFIKNTHVKHEREIDEEVPFENKVQYSFAELIDSVRFQGFANEGERLVVPPVRKEADFLNSQEVKLRLSFNALTTPHDVIGANLGEYHYIKERAEDAAALLAISLKGESVFTLDDLYGALTTDESGNQGEMFLGYKVEYDKVRTYLISALDEALDRLTQWNIIRAHDDNYSVVIDAFRPREAMQYILNQR